MEHDVIEPLTLEQAWFGKKHYPVDISHGAPRRHDMRVKEDYESMADFMRRMRDEEVRELGVPGPAYVDQARDSLFPPARFEYRGVLMST